MKRPVKRHEVVQPLDPSYRFIPLTMGQNATVDAEDFEWLSKWNWKVHCYAYTSYAVRSAPRNYGQPRKEIRMHREILRANKKQEVDHKDFDGLNNRKSNLRLCTHQENCTNRRMLRRNRSGFKGIFPQSGHKRWAASICVSGKRIWLGDFATKEEAAHAYDEAAKVHHHKFAQINH